MKRGLILLALSALFGCASAPENPPAASELYDEATELTNRADYVGADAKYDELVSTYPTSIYTQQAILDQIHSYHNRREFAQAIDSANQFLSLYPDHPRAPYALYMKGVVYFRENRGVLDYLGRQDPTSRAPQLKRLAFEAFRELVEKYPDSEYAPDSAERMKYLINALARNEIHIANYYHKRGAYLAVVGRADRVLSDYPDSASVEEALMLLEDAYRKMGADSAADDARRLLEINFPAGEKSEGDDEESDGDFLGIFRADDDDGGVAEDSVVGAEEESDGGLWGIFGGDDNDDGSVAEDSAVGAEEESDGGFWGIFGGDDEDGGDEADKDS